LDFEFASRIGYYLQAHRKIEMAGRTIPVVEYAQPTAAAFEYVFGLMACLPAMGRHREFYSQLGGHVGAAIISFDCAFDWRHDASTGQFNPLIDLEAVDNAVDFSRVSLEKAAQLCDQYLGADSRSARIVRSVAARIRCWSPERSANLHQAVEILGLSGQQRYVYARSDCGGTACLACCCCAAMASCCDSDSHVHVFHHDC
jgi:hypothetical protein